MSQHFLRLTIFDKKGRNCARFWQFLSISVNQFFKLTIFDNYLLEKERVLSIIVKNKWEGNKLSKFDNLFFQGVERGCI